MTHSLMDKEIIHLNRIFVWYIMFFNLITNMITFYMLQLWSMFFQGTRFRSTSCIIKRLFTTQGLNAVSNVSVFSLMVLFSLDLMVDSQKNLLLLLLTVTLLYVYDQQVIFAAVFVAFFVRFLVE